MPTSATESKNPKVSPIGMVITKLLGRIGLLHTDSLTELDKTFIIVEERDIRSHTVKLGRHKSQLCATTWCRCWLMARHPRCW